MNCSPGLDHISRRVEFDDRRGWGTTVSQTLEKIVLRAGGDRTGPRSDPDMIVLGDVDRADHAGRPAVRQWLWPIRIITKSRYFISGVTGRLASLLRLR